MIKVINRTPFVVHHQAGGRAPAEFSVLHPEPWSRVVQVVVKATFDVANGSAVPAVRQLPILERSGQTDLGYMEGDLSFEKDGVDLVVLAEAHAPRAIAVREMQVGVGVGAASWNYMVTGDRVWTKQGNSFRPTDPLAFTRMGLDYDRAFGGTYTLEAGSELPFMRNPIGKGWTPNIAGAGFEGRPLANLESMARRALSPEEELDPAGFAWYRMGWALRMLRGVKLRDAGRPPEVLPRLWNGAHPDLVLPQYPGGQRLRLDGMTGAGRLEFEVPRLAIEIEHSLNGRPESLRASPDTICILPSWGQMFVVARWLVSLDPADLTVDRFISIVPASSNAVQERLGS